MSVGIYSQKALKKNPGNYRNIEKSLEQDVG
jgi:hypothetical protein